MKNVKDNIKLLNDNLHLKHHKVDLVRRKYQTTLDILDESKLSFSEL